MSPGPRGAGAEAQMHASEPTAAHHIYKYIHTTPHDKKTGLTCLMALGRINHSRLVSSKARAKVAHARRNPAGPPIAGVFNPFLLSTIATNKMCFSKR